MNYRIKLLAFFVGALGILFLLNAGYSAVQTFSRLDAVEADRDQWQKPADVIHSLDLNPGNVVADLGSGSGYFTLKLSESVGRSGRVVAEDIRRLPLVFLWFRAAARHEHNVQIVHGNPKDPHLPPHIDAVLISNTYHEFTDAHAILVHVYQALVPGGRLVVIDRVPRQVSTSNPDVSEHEISPDQVETELRRENFEIDHRQDDFIQQDSYGENWWLIAARKPEQVKP